MGKSSDAEEFETVKRTIEANRERLERTVREAEAEADLRAGDSTLDDAVGDGPRRQNGA